MCFMGLYQNSKADFTRCMDTPLPTGDDQVADVDFEDVFTGTDDETVDAREAFERPGVHRHPLDHTSC